MTEVPLYLVDQLRVIVLNHPDHLLHCRFDELLTGLAVQHLELQGHQIVRRLVLVARFETFQRIGVFSDDLADVVLLLFIGPPEAEADNGPSLLNDAWLRNQLNKTDMWSDLLGEWTTVDGELYTEVLVDWYNAEKARDILPKLDLNRDEAQLITSALSSPYDLLMDAVSIPVRVGTIHSSKGMEAEASIVMAGISGNQYERYRNGYENEEQRLYYVACTRG